MKVGDYVTLEKWDATVPPYNRLGRCRIIALNPARSQSGILADVKNVAGKVYQGLDIAWLTEDEK